MNIRFSLLILLMLCAPLFAETSQRNYSLQTGEAGFFKIEHAAKSILIKTKYGIHSDSKESYYSPQYIYIPATSEATQKVQLNVIVKPFPHIPSDIKISKLSSEKIPIHKYIEIFVRLKSISFDSNSSKKSTHIIDILTNFSGDRDFQEFIKHELLYVLISKLAWSDTINILSNLTSNSDRSIFTQCSLVNSFLQHQTSMDAPLLLSMISNLAGTMAVNYRTKGDIKRRTNSPLNINTYQEICSPIFTNSNSPFNIKRTYPLDSDWQLNDDVDLLFKYVIDNYKPNKATNHALILSNLWLYYNFKGEHSKAQAAAVKALAIYQSQTVQNTEKILQLFNHIFISSIRLGQYAKAREINNQGLELSKRNNKSYYELSLFNAGFLYNMLGEFDAASRYFDYAINNLTGATDWNVKQCVFDESIAISVANAMVIKASSLRQSKQLKKANLWLLCAQRLLQDSRDYYEVVLKVELARIAIESQNVYSAKGLIKQVMEDSRTLKHAQIDAMLIYLDILNLEGNKNELKNNILELATLFNYPSFYDLNLKISEAYPIRQIEAMTFLITLHKDDEDRQWIKFFSKTVLKLIDIHGGKVTNFQAWNAARFKFVQTYLASFFHNREIRPDADLAELFEVLENYYSIDPEKDKNVFSLDNLSSKRKEIAEELFKKWITLEKKVLNSESTASLNKRDIAKEGFLSSYDNSRFHTFNTRYNFAETIAKIPDDHLVIRYVISEEANFALIHKKNSLVIHALPDFNELSDLIQKTTLSINDYQSFMKNSYRLTRLLLPNDLLQPEKYSKLIIIPDGQLHRLPLSALNTADTENQYLPLASKVETVMTYSINTYYDSHNTSKNNNKFSMSLFAGSNFSIQDLGNLTVPSPSEFRGGSQKKYSQLPGTLIEANTFLKIVDGQDIRVGLKENATNSFLMSTETRNSSLIHIATHGYYDANTPEFVGLVTSSSKSVNDSGASFLSISELLSKPFSSDLVIISGCETMLGKHYKGSGMRSISRGFLSQGVGSVLGTLWPIQDRATAKFMERFYLRLLETQNTSTALQKAQQDFFSHGRYRHPKYWAGFVLTVANRQYEKITITPKLNSSKSI